MTDGRPTLNTSQTQHHKDEKTCTTPMTQACKRKVPIDPSLPKKAKKTARKPLGGIKITGSKQKAPASTPPSGIWKGIPILRSKRYTYLKFYLLPFVY
jgi:hypothetical protein